MAPRFAVVLRTNLTSMNNVDDFLKNTAQYLGKRLDTSVKVWPIPVGWLLYNG